MCFKKNIKLDSYEENISFAFNCSYDENLHLHDSFNNHFDSGDIRIKIDEAVEYLTKEKLLEFEKKNNGIADGIITKKNKSWETLLGLI